MDVIQNEKDEFLDLMNGNVKAQKAKDKAKAKAIKEKEKSSTQSIPFFILFYYFF